MKKGGWIILIATIFGAAIAVAVFFLSQRSDIYLVFDRKSNTPYFLKSGNCRLDELPNIVQAMSEGSSDIRYAALMFVTPDRPSDDDAINIQLSFENDKLGFDWVLLSPRNIEDQQKFKDFARTKGVVAEGRSENGVSFLRVESGDVVSFAAQVATEMYHIPPDATIGLVHEGFAWPQNGT